MDERRITTDADVAEGADWLSRHCPRMAAVLPDLAPLPLRLRPGGFGALLDAIVSQQVSVASARAISAKLADAGLTDPEAIRAAGAEGMKAAGLSRQKARYAVALAEAGINYDGLGDLPTDRVLETLTAVTGIGVWTAEIYAKFCLGRADVFAAGDLALQEAARMLYALPERPSEKALRAQSEDWRPWRSVAARLLWAYYADQKSREGIT